MILFWDARSNENMTRESVPHMYAGTHQLCQNRKDLTELMLEFNVLLNTI